MSTVKEIEAVLPQLTTDDLVRIEKMLHGLYRKRGAGPVVYDDGHGTATEAELVAEADAAFQAYDRAEEQNAKNRAR